MSTTPQPPPSERDVEREALLLTPIFGPVDADLIVGMKRGEELEEALAGLERLYRRAKTTLLRVSVLRVPRPVPILAHPLLLGLGLMGVCMVGAFYYADKLQAMAIARRRALTKTVVKDEERLFEIVSARVRQQIAA